MLYINYDDNVSPENKNCWTSNKKKVVLIKIYNVGHSKIPKNAFAVAFQKPKKSQKFINLAKIDIVNYQSNSYYTWNHHKFFVWKYF